MQLIILIFIHLIATSNTFAQGQKKQVAQKQNRNIDVDIFDPYNNSLVFDPSIPNKDPLEALKNREEKKTSHTYNIDFAISPRIAYTEKNWILGQESIFLFGKINKTYNSLLLSSNYKAANIYTQFILKRAYNIDFELEYEKTNFENHPKYESISFLGQISLRQKFFYKLALYTGILLSDHTLWPSIGLKIGKEANPIAYYNKETFFWIDMTVYSELERDAFFKSSINYKFSFILGPRSMINIFTRYLYNSSNTHISKSIKLGRYLRAYSLFEPINSNKLLYISPSLSFLIVDRTYLSLMYEGGFLIDSLGDISMKSLKSSYSVELGYISKSIKDLKYFIYYAIGENKNSRIMLGIKY